jgi:predicted  nucleic acid-binding Zn-ribbon protein
MSNTDSHALPPADRPSRPAADVLDQEEPSQGPLIREQVQYGIHTNTPAAVFERAPKNIRSARNTSSRAPPTATLASTTSTLGNEDSAAPDMSEGEDSLDGFDDADSTKNIFAGAEGGAAAAAAAAAATASADELYSDSAVYVPPIRQVHAADPDPEYTEHLEHFATLQDIALAMIASQSQTIANISQEKNKIIVALQDIARAHGVQVEPDLDATIYARRIHDAIQEKIGTLTSEQSSQATALSQLQATLQTLEKEKRAEQTAHEDAIAKLSAKQLKVTKEHEATVRRLKDDHSEDRRITEIKLRNLRDEKDTLDKTWKAKVAESEQQIERLNAEIDRLKALQTKSSQELEIKTERIRKLEEEIRMVEDDRTTKVTEKEQQIEELNTQITQLQTKYSVESSKQQQEVKRLNERIQDLASQIEKLKVDHTAQQARMQDEIASLRSHLTAQQQQSYVASQEVQRLTGLIDESKRAANKLEARIASMKQKLKEKLREKYTRLIAITKESDIILSKPHTDQLALIGRYVMEGAGGAGAGSLIQ